MKKLSPHDHGEAVALFRAEIIGALSRRDLEHGELQEALRGLSEQRFRPPRSHGHGPRGFSVPTLERWYYGYRALGLEALRPKLRCDRGRARELTREQRDLLLAIREEHPRASVSVILRTLVADGRIAADAVSVSTIRRFFREHGLDRVALREVSHGKIRLKWQAERPGALWHADVCHTSIRLIDGTVVPVRIHGLIDDASRYCLVLEARRHEKEQDMLAMLVRALRRFPAPDALYVDNGSTYTGENLRIACERLGVTLVHAKPYDAPARGKMERFWRTLRDGCLEFCGAISSLHDLNVRLIAWVDEHYHRAPHGGLLGKTPAEVFEVAPGEGDLLDEARLRIALTVRSRRRVRTDNTLEVDGQTWETTLSFLASRVVTVGQSLATPEAPPWIEHEKKAFLLQKVDPVANASRKRTPVKKTHAGTSDFQPADALARKLIGSGGKR
jgi:putative transposase